MTPRRPLFYGILMVIPVLIPESAEDRRLNAIFKEFEENVTDPDREMRFTNKSDWKSALGRLRKSGVLITPFVARTDWTV